MSSPDRAVVLASFVVGGDFWLQLVVDAYSVRVWSTLFFV